MGSTATTHEKINIRSHIARTLFNSKLKNRAYAPYSENYGMIGRLDYDIDPSRLIVEDLMTIRHSERRNLKKDYRYSF